MKQLHATIPDRDESNNDDVIRLHERGDCRKLKMRDSLLNH